MFATAADAKEAYAGENAGPARLKAVMVSAAGLVSRIAPAPSPVPSRYEELAASAEIVAGEYFWQTGGFVKSDGVMQASRTFGTLADVERAVEGIMAEYAKKDEEPTEDANYGAYAGWMW